MARRKVIALLTNNAGTRDDYQGSLRSGVEQACIGRDLDLWVYAGRTDYRPSGGAQLQVFRLVAPSRVDGIVVAAGCLAATSSLDEVLGFLGSTCPVPICSVGHPCSLGPSVFVDNRAGAEQLIDHLVLVHGHSRFAYIAGPRGHQESEERVRATRAALTRHGLELDPDAVGYGDFLPPSGGSTARELLERLPGIQAIVAANDNMAFGALKALESAGLRCPEDVAIAGFDDAAIGRTSLPSLTTVRQPVERLGSLAVGLIEGAWRGDPGSSSVTVPTEIVIRESCGCHRGHGEALRHAGAEVRTRASCSEVVRLLVPLVDDPERRQEVAERLCAAVDAERAGRPGTLSEALEDFMARLPRSDAPIHELHRVLTSLRGHPGESEPNLSDAFDDARIRIAQEAFRREGNRRCQNDAALEELRITGERLATALTLPALGGALETSLPRFGITNAIVSLYERNTLERLVPLVHLTDGVPRPCSTEAFPAELLFPEDAPRPLGRISMTVLPLTSQAEHIGVALIELPAPLDVFTLLREEIGSAVKSAYVHQEILNQERRNAQAQEEQRVTAAQLRSLNTIASGVAHDLNNSLGPLLALPDTIRRSLQESSSVVPTDVIEDLETIQAAGQRAAHTIHDLVSLGQATNLPRTVIDLNRLLERECGAFIGVCGQGNITVRVTTHPRPLPIRASKPHLVRAVLNLVLNARDAIEQRGVIVVRSVERRLEERVKSVETIEPGRYAVIEVQDTGSGIPDELMPRILEPFFTAKSSSAARGTGLGLSIVHRIVKDCGGYLRVESQVGRGTTFGLYFPIHGDEPCSVSGRPPPPLRGSERILVVDDDTVQLRTARRVLSQLGYAVATAESGQGALDLLSASRPDAGFDLIVVDMIMPHDMNGIATIEAIRNGNPAQKALIVSGFAPEQMESLARERGVQWLAKPYTLSQLASAVRAALDGRELEPSGAPS